MKKMLVLVSLLFCLAGIVKAEEGGIYFKIGNLEFTYPLANTNAIALYDFWKAEGYLGLESRILKFQRLNLNVGAITSFQSNGMPFVSLDYDWADAITNFPECLLKMGIWFGRDFDKNDNRAGIKLSKAIW